MKKLIFPSFNRVHLSRQKLLLDKLREHFEVHITTYGEKDMSMSGVAVDIANKFQVALDTIKPDFALIRGDRFECLVPAMLCAYNNVPIAHIEGFDRSGVIDDKVRYAISYLSDYHFVTNQDSYNRAKSMGFENVWNYGSLDCEYALECSQTLKFDITCTKPYLVVLYHQIEKENATELLNALKEFENYDIIGIKGNKDYAQSLYKEQFNPQEFILLLKNTACLIGNSSAGIKEAGVLGAPVVNIGSRQSNRLQTHNIINAKCETEDIKKAIKQQLEHGKYEIDNTYLQPDTSLKITEVLTSILK